MQNDLIGQMFQNKVTIPEVRTNKPRPQEENESGVRLITREM